MLAAFGGSGLVGFVAWTSKLGILFYLGYLAAFGEFIGGILLLLGVYAELGTLMVIPVMLGAVLLVHWVTGFFIQNNGFEYPFSLFVFLIAITIGGPGHLALIRTRR